MDLLSLAANEMRLLRADYRALSLEAGAARAFARGEANLHFLEAGSVDVQHEGPSITALEGDVILLSTAAPHTLFVRDGASVISGQLAFEAVDHPLLQVLPRLVHAPRSLVARSPRLAHYVQGIVAEVRDARDGTDVLLARLTDAVIVEAMRFFTPPPGVECPVGGFFGALNDAPVRRVLVALHESPEKPWTVASLAEIAGESRSAFAAHFASVMKEPPMAYLARWRMFRGRNLLRQTDLGLAQIAERTGYGSAAAFAQAFTREHGLAPGAYRAEAGVFDR